MANLPIYQYDTCRLEQKYKMCSVRWSSEGVNTRLVQPDSTKDVIPYANIVLQPYVVEWGHALMNLSCPFRIPGSDSGLPADYWGGARIDSEPPMSDSGQGRARTSGEPGSDSGLPAD